MTTDSTTTPDAAAQPAAPSATPANTTVDGAYGGPLSAGEHADVMAVAGMAAIDTRDSVADAAPAGSETPRAFVPPTLDVGAARENAAGGATTLDLLADVTLDVKVELGRTQMLVDEVLKLGPGSVVELDKLAGDPVDIYVNERLVARGEVLVLNDDFCVRISEIITPAA